jgi:hypothetical protein
MARLTIPPGLEAIPCGRVGEGARVGDAPLLYGRTKWALRFHCHADSSWPTTKGRSLP